MRQKAIEQLRTLLHEVPFDEEVRLNLAVAVVELERVEYGTVRHPLGYEYTLKAAKEILWA